MLHRINLEKFQKYLRTYKINFDVRSSKLKMVELKVIVVIAMLTIVNVKWRMFWFFPTVYKISSQCAVSIKFIALGYDKTTVNSKILNVLTRSTLHHMSDQFMHTYFDINLNTKEIK